MSSRSFSGKLCQSTSRLFAISLSDSRALSSMYSKMPLEIQTLRDLNWWEQFEQECQIIGDVLYDIGHGELAHLFLLMRMVIDGLFWCDLLCAHGWMPHSQAGLVRKLIRNFTISWSAFTPRQKPLPRCTGSRITRSWCKYSRFPQGCGRHAGSGYCIAKRKWAKHSIWGYRHNCSFDRYEKLQSTWAGTGRQNSISHYWWCKKYG